MKNDTADTLVAMFIFAAAMLSLVGIVELVIGKALNDVSLLNAGGMVIAAGIVCATIGTALIFYPKRN